MTAPRTILVAIDLDPLSLETLGRAAERARLFGASLVVVHVYAGTAPTPPIPLPGVGALHKEAQRALEDAVAQRVRAFVPEALLEGIDHRIELLGHPHAGEALCERAAQDEVDLIVVGSHHRTGLGRVLLGSVAERVVRGAPCDVLVIRAETPE